MWERAVGGHRDKGDQRLTFGPEAVHIIGLHERLLVLGEKIVGGPAFDTCLRNNTRPTCTRRPWREMIRLSPSDRIRRRFGFLLFGRSAVHQVRIALAGYPVIGDSVLARAHGLGGPIAAGRRWRLGRVTSLLLILDNAHDHDHHEDKQTERL